MKKIISGLGFACLVILMIVSHSYANGVLLDSIGPVSSGRGTNIAHTDNDVLILDNPAGLTELKPKMIETYMDILLIMPSYTDPENNKDGDSVFCFLPSVSYTHELVENRLSAGFGVFCPAGFSTKYNLLHSVYGQQEYYSYATLTKLLAGFAWRATDQLSIGLSLGPSYSKMEFKQPHAFQIGTLAGTFALLDLEVDGWSISSNLGAQWRVSSNTTIGLAYHFPDKFNLSGTGNVDFTGSPLPVDDTTARYDLDYDFTWPQSIGIGIVHTIEDKHRISLDIEWIDWSSAFDKLILKLSNGDNPEFNFLSGGSSVKDILPMDWNDSYSFSLGYEYFLKDNILRCGYVYHKNPVPNSTLIPCIPGILQHLIAVGYGRRWNKWSFDFAYNYSFGSTQSVGTSRLLGGDYNNSTVDVDFHMFSMGMQYHF